MNIRKMYTELLVTSVTLNIFDSILTTITAFSIIYFVLYFYRIPYLVAIAASAAFFLWSFIRKIRQNKILVLEQKYPDFKERLRTSYEYKTESNTVIDSLHSDITEMMKKVDISAYLDSGRVAFKVLAACILLFSTLYFSSVGLDILDIKTRIVTSSAYESLEEFATGLFTNDDQEFETPAAGDPRLIVLGNEELNANLDVYNTGLDINEISEGEKNDFGGHYPGEISGDAQEIYEEDIPEEDKEVVREYFKKINQ
ncbi:TPA: hypothetical protein HA239_01445 [Candidatus Woesearchaeota archaeon]|nr:hypothetical protein QT06_C0001G0890 [archaeon GW2011_AR15]MBS3103332.1 hypothetical protein [Candidatus Woesearchaeota archaeon]HIH41057.1 hypothetical protein [Candidatus Woesearchaeota archaeon]